MNIKGFVLSIIAAFALTSCCPHHFYKEYWGDPPHCNQTYMKPNFLRWEETFKYHGL